MIVLQIVEAATGARSRPASFESLVEFVARFRAAFSENPWLRLKIMFLSFSMALKLAILSSFLLFL